MALQGFFPLLTDPFPAPEVEVVSAERSGEGEPVGVGITDCYREGANKRATWPHHVRVSIIKEDSPFYGSDLHIGQQLLAVNQQAVTSSSQGATLIRQAKQRAITFWSADTVQAPYCRHFAFNLDQATASCLTFGAACGGRLVQITRVAKEGPLKGLCMAGDIVLAVNGMPVSTPEMAGQILRHAVLAATTRHGQGDRRTTLTSSTSNAYSTAKPVSAVCMTLYLVEIQALRRSLTHQVIAHFVNSGKRGAAEWKKIGLRYNAAPTNRSIPSTGGTVAFKVHGQLIAESLGFDPDSLRMKDMVGPMQPTSGLLKTLGYRGMASWKYDTMVVPFIDRYNTLLDMNLGPLCEAVANEVQQESTETVVGGQSLLTAPPPQDNNNEQYTEGQHYSEPIAVDRLYGDEMRRRSSKNVGDTSWQPAALVSVDSHDDNDDEKKQQEENGGPQHDKNGDNPAATDVENDLDFPSSEMMMMEDVDLMESEELVVADTSPAPTTSSRGGVMSFMTPRIKA